jgi:hypothetical protein
VNELEARDLLRLLPEREAQAIEARYWHKKGLQAVGEALGVSRERARQLIVKGQKRMKNMMTGEQRVSRRAATTRRKCRICRSADHAIPSKQADLARLHRRTQESVERDCLAYLAGKIKTQTEIAAKYGVTRACVSRRVCLARERQGIAPTAKQIAARKTCALRQMITMNWRPRMTEKQKATQQLWQEGLYD